MKKPDDLNRSAAPRGEVTSVEKTSNMSSISGVPECRSESFFSIEPDGSGAGSVVRFTLTRGEADGARSFVAVPCFCPSPTCGCGFLTLECHPDPGGSVVSAGALGEESSLSIELDLFDRVVKPAADSPRDATALAQVVADELRDGDWALLMGCLQGVKRGQMETMDLATIDAWFPPEVAVDGAMMGYGEVFPWGEQWTFESDGERWMVGDEYCVQPGCDCAQVMLAFFRPLDGGAVGEGELPVAELYAFFNYKTGKHQLEKVSSGCPAQRLISDLRVAYPALDKKLARRHNQLQQLGRRLIGKRGSKLKNSIRKLRSKLADEGEADSAKATAGPSAPVAGRNDPCPCGSGRKFKKCCMGGG